MLFWERGTRGNTLIVWVNVFARRTNGGLSVRPVSVAPTACAIRAFTARVFVPVTTDGRARNATVVTTDINPNPLVMLPPVTCVKPGSLETNVNFVRPVIPAKIVPRVTRAGTHGNILLRYFPKPSPPTIDIFATNVCPTTGGFTVGRVPLVTTCRK